MRIWGHRDTRTCGHEIGDIGTHVGGGGGARAGRGPEPGHIWGHAWERGGQGRGRPRCCFVGHPHTPPHSLTHYPAINTVNYGGGRGLAACQQLIGWLPSTLTCSPDPQDDGWLIALTMALIGWLLHPRILIVQVLHPKMLVAHW